MENKHAFVILMSIFLWSCLGAIDYISTVTLPMSPKFRKQNEDVENWTSQEISKLNRKQPKTQAEMDRLNKLLMLQASLNEYQDLNQEYQSWIVELAKDKEGGPIPTRITERSKVLANQWNDIEKNARDLGYSENSHK
jgi:peptidoglycan hydrolase CwlO-like protein